MTEKKNINKTALILHTIPIWFFIFLNETEMPLWYEDYINPEEALSMLENVILFAITLPIMFLVALWFKSLFNIIIPKIFNFRDINYWEAYGLLLLSLFFGM
ncbi:MAG: hypothetical protein CMD36_06640 [Flavobacteriales bacterium]|nr:hypothetical protein [Flavobacteriales bacterium]|tara:strand:- start:1047 stop:1352 length:306 start_codon:yes stop_codon:yes gene_type:complete